MKRHLAATGAAILLTACASTDSPPSISAAIAGIQNDLANAHVVGAAHPTTWTDTQANLFNDMIRAQQCAQNRSDPIVAVLTGPVSIQLIGSFTRSGNFALATAGLTMPSITVNGDGSRTKSQQLSLPVAFTPLSALPDAELSRALAYEAVMFGLQAGLQDAVVARERSAMLVDRDLLATKIRAAISDFNFQHCPAGPVGPFATLRQGAQRPIPKQTPYSGINLPKPPPDEPRSQDGSR